MAKPRLVACPNCAREVPERFRLCGHCGATLAPDRAAEEIRRTVTIVTSDWKGSTSLGEKLDAESLRELQTRYFDEMQLVYEAYGGTIEKIIGDAIVAVFGLPTRRDDDPLRGVAAAAESLRTLANLNEQFELAYGVRVIVRTGIASGEVVVGAATAGQHVLTGETVRTATAMEQSAPAGEALLAPSTYELVRGLVDVQAVAAFTPKGMSAATEAYRLVAISQEAEASLRETAQDEVAAVGSQACVSCGEENLADFVTCGTCGASLARVARAQERRKTVTVVFANPKLASVSEEAISAEVQRAVMSRYFDAMRPALEKHGGTVEKFIGDAVMAVFGLPVQHEDDALRASRAALEMLEALATLNVTLAEEEGVTVQNQVGVNTGEVIAGDAATGQRLVTGDAVNTAARLEQAAPPQQVLIGELTYRLVRDAAQVEPVEALELKGKAERVAAYRLLSVSGAVEGFRRRQDAPMVGREHEMASLSSIFERARDEGAARMATVIADAGTGKSRLIREFVDSCDDNSIILRGRCLPYGEGITFWPLVDAARSAAGIEADDNPEQGIAKLRALIHDRAVSDRIAATIGLTAEQFGVTEIFWATRKMLEQLGADRTAIWVIDDIHWAEQTLLDLIVHLLEVAEAPILVLCSSRHDVLETHPDWALRPDSLRLVLQPLTDSDAAVVVQNLLGKAGISGSVQDRIVRAAEGNPLYVEQMLSMLIDSGRVRMVGDRWEPTMDISEMAVPPTIQALLSSRLDLLEPGERTVIEPAAVIGLEFAEEAVEELTPDEIRREVPVHLEAMTRKQLVRPSGSMNIEDASFRFMHILIKDAAYNGLLKRARARFHEGFVTWADRVNRERGRSLEFEELNGYHLEQAYRYLGELGPLDDHGHTVGARASVLLASAGRRAQARGDTPAAVNLLRRAAATRTQADPERFALLPDLGEALMEQGEFEDAERVLNEAAVAGRQNGDEPLACKATLVNLLVQSFSGVSDESADWTTLAGSEVEKALPVFEAAADFAGLALAWRLRSGVAGTAGRYGEAAVANEQVIAYARQAGNLRLETRGATGLAVTMLYGPTPVPEAIIRCEELAERSRADQRSAAIISAQLCQLYAMQGQFERARALYSGARATLQDLGAGVLASSTSIDSSRVEMLAGDFPAAERELRRDYEALDAIGERYLLSTVAGLLARAIEAQGRHDEAEAITKRVEEIAAPDDPVEQATWRAIAARILARRLERERAVQLATEAVVLRRQTDSPMLQAEALLDLADVLRETGDVAGADAAVAEALQLAEAKGDIVTAARLRPLLATAVT